jgi:2-hydroxychromene-2-carboxylate isomerase
VPRPIDFWYEFASPYACVAAALVQQAQREGRAAFHWRPFLLGPIFSQAGTPSPFIGESPKARYLWRDIERCFERVGLPYRRPSAFPRNSVRAARIALLMPAQPELEAWTLAVYRANFELDLAIDDPVVLTRLLGECGLDAAHFMAASESPQVKESLRRATQAAAEAGIFGVPAFIVGTELFWGADRIEDAIAWSQRD